MELSLPLKAQANAILSNTFITSLIRDGKFVAENGDTVTLEGALNFSLSMAGDRLLLTLHDMRPRVVAKRLMGLVRVKAKITSISIGPSDVIVGIEDWPDLTIPLE